MKRKHKIVDASISEPLLGNPVAVVLAAEHLDHRQMRAIARWTNLSETTFVLPPRTEHADCLRIFSLGGELPYSILGRARVACRETRRDQRGSLSQIHLQNRRALRHMCRRNTALLKARQAIAAHRIDRPVRHLGITSKLAASGDGLSAGPRKAQSSALAGALPGPAFASACLRKIVIPHDERIHIDRNRSERCFDQSRSFRALHVSLEGWQRADHAE